MSQTIYIIDLDRLGLPAPRLLSELWGMIEGMQEQRAGPNSKFVELARRLVAKFPEQGVGATGADPGVHDSIWLSSPVKEAEKIEAAVWVLGLPRERWADVLVSVVEEGTKLGLALLDDSIGLGFLPDGRVIPEERREEWEQFQQEATLLRRPTKAQIRKKVGQLLEKRLAIHGFVRVPVPKVRYFEGVDGMFDRPVEAGLQRIDFTIRERYDEFSCEVFFRGYCPAIRAIHNAAFGISLPDEYPDYAFGLSYLDPSKYRYEVDTDEQIEALWRSLETAGLSSLDGARDLRGIDWLHNHPESLPGPSVRESEYTGLISAYLVHNPRFDELVRFFAEKASKQTADFPNRDSGRPQDLERLLQYLRGHVNSR